MLCLELRNCWLLLLIESLHIGLTTGVTPPLITTTPAVPTQTDPPDTTTTTLAVPTPTDPPDTTTTTLAVPTPTDPPDTTTTTLAVPTPTDPPATATPATSPVVPTLGASPGTTTPAALTGCDQTLTATTTTQEFSTSNYPSNYDNNMDCTISISAATNYVITLTQSGFSFESETYCSYDHMAVYDGSSTSASLLGQYCTTFPTSIDSSSNALTVKFISDYSTVSTGAKINYLAIDNSYPGCKSAYTSYTATSSIQTFSVGTPYTNNLDSYFLVLNSGTLILQLTSMAVENSHGCIYDRITIYDGGCKSFTVLNTHCGTFLKRWELTGTEYLVQFHSDSSATDNGFTMQYFLGTANTGAPTTTTTTVGPPLALEVNLVNEVLTNYTAESFPVRDLSAPISSTVNLYLVGINGLDEVAQKLTTTILFEVQWNDDFLGWPTAKKLGMSKLLIPQNDIWKPDLALINGFEKITSMGAAFMFIVVDNTGNCIWKPYQIMDSVCQVDMTTYPYDTQKCKLKFSTWGASSDQVLTSVGANGLQKHDSFVENSEWTLLSISQGSETVDGQVIIEFTLTMKRNHKFVVFYVAVPVVLLSYLNAFTFALPVCSGEKSGYAITVFLSFVVYVIVTFQKMPENSDTTSIFALYVLIMTCISTFTVMMVTLQIRMVELKTKFSPMSVRMRSFTKCVQKLQYKSLCISDAVEEIQYAEQRHAEEYGDDEADAEDDAWPNFVSALDFVCFWVFMLFSILMSLVVMVYLMAGGN